MLLLSISADSLAICSDVVSYNGERPPKVVFGSAIKSNGGSAAGANVLAQASGLPDETTTVLSNGWWQFDVSGDAGHTEWPDGTSFNVTITIDGWEGTTNGVVQGISTYVGLVTLYANKIIADASGPYSGTICNPVQFSGSAYGGAPPYDYNWYFGDGVSGSGQNPSHQYTSDGTYTVTLTVTDDSSDTSTDTATVTISTTELVADAGGPYSGVIDQAVQFEGSAISGTTPYSYEWDFGDGGSSTDQNPTHVYTSVGTYDVILTVTDDDGKTDTDETTATISEGTADLSCAGSLTWKTKSQGTVTGSFSVSNIGDPGTNLDWEIDSYPEWGSWTFTPEQDDDLTPEAGATTVQVTVVAPQEKQEFSGKVKVINKENPSDFCEISVSLTVPKAYNSLLEFLELFAQRMPILKLVLEIIQLI